MLIATPEAQRMQSSRAIQHTYGHFTFGGVMNVFDCFIKPWESFPNAALSKLYAMTMHSILLDIGSGFGFPSFIATCLTQCRSLGLEVVEGRVE